MSKVSTYFSTSIASANALTASLSSCMEGSKQYGIVIWGPSLGSNIAGWVDTAAANGESVNAARVTTWSCNLRILFCSQLGWVFFAIHTFPPQQSPTAAHMVITPFVSSSISFRIPGIFSLDFPGFPSPAKYAATACFFASVSIGNQLGLACWP